MSHHTKKNQIVVAGSTGLIGQEVLKLLSSDVATSVSVLARREIILNHPHHQLIISDLKNIDLPEAEADSNSVICALGTTIKKAGSKQAFEVVDLEMVIKLAEAAKKRGYNNFAVVSSIGASERGGNFYLKTKRRMENALIALNFDSLTILRPSLLLGKRAEFRLGEKLGEWVFKIISPLFLGPTKKYKPIAASKVAQKLVNSVNPHEAGVHIIESDKI